MSALKKQTIQKLCFRNTPDFWRFVLWIYKYGILASVHPQYRSVTVSWTSETTLNPSLHLKAAFKITAGNCLKIYNTRTLRPGIV